MLKEKERGTKVETAVGKAIYTETGSGTEIKSETVSSWPEGDSGSGDGREDGKGSNDPQLFDSMGKGKRGSNDKEDIKGDEDVESGRRDGLQLPVSLDTPTTEFPPFGSSEDNGNGGGDGHDEEDQNTSLDGGVVDGDSTIEENRQGDGDGKQSGSEGHMEGGGKENRGAGGAGESLQELLFSAGRSPMLGRLVPLLRLTDTDKAAEEQMEGKWYTMLSFSSALPRSLQSPIHIFK